MKGGSTVQDEEIIQLYWDRDENAIYESSRKYGAFCSAVARNILHNRADEQECVNDTWLQAWNSMPPNRPSFLQVYLGKITRNLSFNLYKKMHREKRGGTAIDLVLDELAECVSGKDDPEKTWQASQLAEEINAFLSSLPKERQYIFILRYWYGEDIREIADRFHMSENNVSVTLNRIRRKLKAYLTERGYDI